MCQDCDEHAVSDYHDCQQIGCLPKISGKLREQDLNCKEISEKPFSRSCAGFKAHHKGLIQVSESCALRVQHLLLSTTLGCTHLQTLCVRPSPLYLADDIADVWMCMMGCLTSPGMDTLSGSKQQNRRS